MVEETVVGIGVVVMVVEWEYVVEVMVREWENVVGRVQIEG